MGSIITGRPILMDEAHVFPGNTWAAHIGREFRRGFDGQDLSYELAFFSSPSATTLRLVEEEMMGIQIRGGHETDPQKTLNAMTQAIVHYATRDFRNR